MPLDKKTHYEALKAHALLLEDVVALYECIFHQDPHTATQAIKVLRQIAAVFATLGFDDKARQVESPAFFSDDHADYVRVVATRDKLVPWNVINLWRPPSDLWDIYRDKLTLERYMEQLEKLADALKVLIDLLRQPREAFARLTEFQPQCTECSRAE